MRDLARIRVPAPDLALALAFAAFVLVVAVGKEYFRKESAQVLSC